MQLRVIFHCVKKNYGKLYKLKSNSKTELKKFLSQKNADLLIPNPKIFFRLKQFFYFFRIFLMIFYLMIWSNDYVLFPDIITKITYP